MLHPAPTEGDPHDYPHYPVGQPDREGVNGNDERSNPYLPQNAQGEASASAPKRGRKLASLYPHLDAANPGATAPTGQIVPGVNQVSYPNPDPNSSPAPKTRGRKSQKSKELEQQVTPPPPQQHQQPPPYQFVHGQAMQYANIAPHPTIPPPIQWPQNQGGEQPRDDQGQPQNGGPARSLSSNKRAEQNRKAQRAFRERRDQHIKELESKSQMLETALNAAAVAEHRLQECQDALESLREQYDILRTDNIHLRHALNSYTRGGLEPEGHVSPLDDDPRALHLHQEHVSEDDEHHSHGENVAAEGENARPTPPVTQSASTPGLTVEETERLSKMTTSESVNYLKHKLYGGSPPAASPNPNDGGEGMVVDEEGDDDDDDDDDDATSDVENAKKKRKVDSEEQVAE